MYAYRPWKVLRRLYAPRSLWRMPSGQAMWHPTFDDGPEPEVTPKVLDILAEHGAGATFFCSGEQAEAHPELVQRILSEGHSLGHHGYTHPDGWRTKGGRWLRDMQRGARAVEAAAGRHVSLFRPPYGRVRPGMWRQLPVQWRPIMWDLMPGDFDARKTAQQICEVTLGRLRPGSIVVFHDSAKAWPRLSEALPVILREAEDRGMAAVSLPDGN